MEEPRDSGEQYLREAQEKLPLRISNPFIFHSNVLKTAQELLDRTHSIGLEMSKCGVSFWKKQNCVREKTSTNALLRSMKGEKRGKKRGRHLICPSTYILWLFISTIIFFLI